VSATLEKLSRIILRMMLLKKAMNRKKLVSSFITEKGFTDIGNKESYKKHIKNIFKNKARTEK
jgi:mannose-1-phosphate guanylyltransferase